MVNKFFKEFSGNKTAFKNGGYETTLANNIVFIMDEANNGAGACIFTRGMYFADFQSLIAALSFVKGINVGGTNYNAAQGGGYVKFEAADPATVVYVDNNGVKIGLSEAFVSAHNAVISDVAAIKADYLKAADKQELTKLVNDKDSAMKQYVDAEIAKVATSESFTALEGRVSTLEGKVKAIEDDYLVGQDRTDLEGLIEAAEGRLGQRITTEAPVTITSADGEGSILKTYTFTQNGKEIGKIDLAKDIVVSSGSIVMHEGVKCLELTLTSGDVVHIPVNDLVDVYTGSEFVNISDTNVISVDKDGIIAGLATDANAQKYANDAKAGAISDAEGKIAAAIAGEVTRSNKYADDAASAAASAAEGRINTKLEGYYTSEQVDSKVSTDLQPYAKTADVNTELAKKANSEEVYSKTAADQLLGGKANVGDSYLKAETDNLLSAKANSSAVYTKGQVDGFLGEKADKSQLDNYYVKSEVEGLVSPKADKSYVDTELGKKANSSDMETALAGKADNATLGNYYLKSETYSQAEVQAMFDSAFAWERIEA
jgi:hypothetical protein